MKRIVIREYSQIVRLQKSASQREGTVYLESHLYDRLKKFDQQREESDRVFRWGDMSAQTQQWVGVIQVPGLQLELLPKIDELRSYDSESLCREARLNLLYMLSVSGDVPVRVRDLAHLTHRRAPLSEALARIFAERLLTELLHGPERSYIEHEENLRSFKGKLLMAKHTHLNAAHRERFYCRFDEFCDDTLMNRIFRAACRRLLDSTQTPFTQDSLRHCLLVLDSVQDVYIHDSLFDKVVLQRQNERFADVFQFCRLILKEHTPTVEAGETQSFSVLFDMNHVFERFVAGFLRTRVLPHFPGYNLFSMSRKKIQHLLSCNGRGILPLKPDLLIEAPGGHRLVLDTKWKRLSNQGYRGGVSTADLYQLYAYTRRYGCVRSVLLYPHVADVSPRDFNIIDKTNEHSGEQVGIRFIRLHRNLHLESERSKLADELSNLLESSFAEINACAQTSTHGSIA